MYVAHIATHSNKSFYNRYKIVAKRFGRMHKKSPGGMIRPGLATVLNDDCYTVT